MAERKSSRRKGGSRLQPRRNERERERKGKRKGERKREGDSERESNGADFRAASHPPPEIPRIHRRRGALALPPWPAHRAAKTGGGFGGFPAAFRRIERSRRRRQFISRRERGRKTKARPGKSDAPAMGKISRWKKRPSARRNGWP